MSPEQKQRRRAILKADDENQYAVVEFLSRSYVEEFAADCLLWICRGRVLAQLCRWSESDSAFEQAILTAVHSEQRRFIWIARSQSFKRRGMLLEAEECYQRLIELEPDDSYVRILLAHTTWMRGDLELAEARFRDALEAESEEIDRDEALFNLGGVLVALGNLEEAAQCYREALELSPDYEIARLRLEDVERAIELQGE